MSAAGKARGLLAVPDVLPRFPPVRWAAAYGSAALQQAGYKPKNNSMIDYVFAVDSPAEWHAANIAANPSHYSFLKYFGSGVVGHAQEHWASGESTRTPHPPQLDLRGCVSESGCVRGVPGVYYNTLIDWDDGLRIKYGVVSVNKLAEDLTDWRHLYIAGRLHKPVITLQPDDEVETALQVTLNRSELSWDSVSFCP